MTRLLISSYSPRTCSSYGIMVRELVSRLHKMGEFEIVQHAWFPSAGMSDVPWPLKDTNYILTDDGKWQWDERDKWGQFTFQKVASEFKPDVVFNLSDVYMSPYLNVASKKMGFRLIRWSLVAADPVQEPETNIIRETDCAVAQTHYAASIWKQATGKNYQVIPPGFDTKIFVPERMAIRNSLREFNTSGKASDKDLFLLWIGVNQERKRPWIPFEVSNYLKTGQWGWTGDRIILRPWNPTTQSFEDWRDGPPEVMAEPVPVKLWVHSAEMPERWSYPTLAQMHRLEGGEDIFCTRGLTRDRGVEPEQLANLYQMADASLMLSGSEGFGIPIIEAAGCGVRSIVTDYSGCGEAGRSVGALMVRPESFHIAPTTHTRIANPSIPHAVFAAYNLYQQKMNDRDTFERERLEISEAAHKQYSYDDIAMRWAKIIRETKNQPKVSSLGVSI